MEGVPSPDYLVPALTYLYTGQLPSPCYHDPDVLYGLLQNDDYLSCERLVKDCCAVLKEKMKDADPSPYITHEAMEMTWVPVEVIATILREKKRAYWAVYGVLQWLRRQTSTKDIPREVVELSQSHAKSLTSSELEKLLGCIMLSLASSIILLPSITAKLKLTSNTLTTERQYKSCTQCFMKIWYLDRDDRRSTAGGYGYHIFESDWE